MLYQAFALQMFQGLDTKHLLREEKTQTPFGNTVHVLIACLSYELPVPVWHCVLHSLSEAPGLSFQSAQLTIYTVRSGVLFFCPAPQSSWSSLKSSQ